jgi:pSer/pThr/pTyr-binding forkhead associated (FHA) protein
MFKLIIQDDEGKTTVVPLLRDEITIGRKEGNSIRLTERNVSRKHARILKSNGAVVVEDLDSYNGVKVNGTRIQGRVSVNESDRIQIGDYLLELKVDRGNQAADGSGFVNGGGGGAGGDHPMSHTVQGAAMSPAALAGVNGAAPAAQRALKPTTPMAPTPAAVESAAPAPAAAASGPGRLVVVSSNFSGREYVLAKPSMVIGRTDDNDIVVNHRSISRHHAKVVLEQGRYCIVDLQSSNGVRVNGEEYGKVELRRGDVIDLGHVRLRYVEPGEDFVFERDAQIVDVAQKGSSTRRSVALALAAVAVLGGAAGLFLVLTRGGSTPAAGPVASAPAASPTPSPAPSAPAGQDHAPQPPVEPAVKPAGPTEPAVAKPVVVAADAGTAIAVTPPSTTPPSPNVTPPVAPVAPPSPAPDDPAALVAEARKAVEAEDWVRAGAAAEKAASADPKNEDAKKLQAQARAELASQQTYKRFTDAKDAGKPADALKLLAQLPKDSVYRPKAEADLPALEEAFVKEREAEAKRMAARGQCDQIGVLARRSADVFPAARAPIEKVKASCVPIAAAEPVEKPAGPVSAAPTTPQDVDSLISEAREAARNASWTDARKKADEVLRIQPDNQDALSVAGVAACNLADKERAQKYMTRLRGARQNMMRQICASRGVTLD